MKNGDTVKKYARTQEELAQCLDLSRKNLTAHWLSKDDWPARTRRGWIVADCLAYMLAYKQATPGKGGRPGSQGDAKTRKTELECQMIQLRIDILKSEFVAVGDHHAAIDELAEFFKDGLELWVQKVGAERRDVELLKWAKDVRDRVRAQLAEKMRGEAA